MMSVLEFLVQEKACRRGIEYVEALAPLSWADLYAQCPRADWLCWILDAAWRIENNGRFPENAWDRDHWKYFLNIWTAGVTIGHVEGPGGRVVLNPEVAYYIFRGWDDTHKRGPVPVAMAWKTAYPLRRFLYNLGQAGVCFESV